MALPAFAAHAQAAPKELALADSARRAQAPQAPSSASAPAAPQSTPASAAQVTEDFSSDRPGFTDGPILLARGTRQVEGGYSFSRAGEERGHAIGEVLLRVGLHSALELRVSLNSYELASGPQGRASGLGDAVVGAKVRLTDGVDGLSFLPQAALLVTTSLPSGSRAFGRNRNEPAATLATTWNAPFGSSLTMNLGAASRDAGDGARIGEYTSGASFDYSLGDHVGSYVEYFSSWTAERGSMQRYLNVGVTLVPGNVFQVDTWTAVGLHRGAPDYSVGLGLTRRF